MKRILKTTAALALALLLCLTLCSCNYLDDMREARAEMDENGDILFQGKRYCQLDYSYEDQLSREALLYFPNAAYLADRDVPDLLLSNFGQTFRCSTDGTVLDYQGRYYVREDYQETLESILKHPQLDTYCVYSYNYLKDEPSYRKTDAQWKNLLDQLAALAAKAAVEGTDPSDTGKLYTTFWSDYVYLCDSSMLLCSRSFAIVGVSDTESDEASGYYVLDSDSQMAVMIPAEYDEALAEFLSDYNLY